MGNDQPQKPHGPPQDPSDKMLDTMFEFKMMAKQMEKEWPVSEVLSRLYQGW